MLTEGSVLSEPSLDGEDVYWLELHPWEKGRIVLFNKKDGERAREVLPSSFNVRTRVHEYGGGAYCENRGTIYFSNFTDQIVYHQEEGGRPAPISFNGLRYADFIVDEKRERLIGVREDHSDSPHSVVNTIASIGLRDSSTRVLASGNDFYSAPRLHPSGSRLAWLTWNFPNMPWDGTELWVGDLGRDGALTNRKLVAGGLDESILQPEWSPRGVLHFISDRNGFWNIYRWIDGKADPLHSRKADFGRQPWVFRTSTYAFESEETIVCSFAKDGVWHLATIETATLKFKPIRVPFTSLEYVKTHQGYAVFLGGSPTEPTSIVSVKLADGSWKTLYRPKVQSIPRGFLSSPHHFDFKTARGKNSHGFLYPPRNRNYKAPKGERPPLIVVCHGGPTSAARTERNLGIQAWTSRGFAVLDVNYGGSTGYGRAYRKRLEGKWGIADVDDCVNGALHLVRRGRVDGEKLIIRGQSAGGYTTLCALTFKKVFKTGASYYGVSDLESLAMKTHKFESRYLDKLIGPYPEQKDVYRERSAIHHVDLLSCPVIFFQGLEDPVVSPSQAETVVRSLRQRGIPVAYLSFDGEQHGFRKADSIKRSFEAELYFYSKILRIPLPDRVAPVPIENLR
ncbi:MAG: prolyl oligopeptidase family serine peptidase [Thaumarchaeota archaeon]|nr:prolyl oligopeptidase family serine peptidase [Nitrososphaerota archaeon]